MNPLEESAIAQSNQQQQDQPDSSSELPMFTLIHPDRQQAATGSGIGILKNDTNNNSNDRNNNNGKAHKVDSTEDDGNNNINNHKRLALSNLQRYQLDNGAESPVHPHHHLLLLQQQQHQQQQHQQQQQQQHLSHQQMGGHGLMDKQSETSPSLIVLQPSGQGGAYSSILSGFNHYAPGNVKAFYGSTLLWTTPV